MSDKFLAIIQAFENQIISFAESHYGNSFIEVLKNSRLDPFQVAIPPFSTPSGGFPSYLPSNYKDAFNIDYNSSNLFSLQSINNNYENHALGTVIITANGLGDQVACAQSWR